MHIAHVCPVDPGAKGGMGRVAERYLHAQLKDGDETKLFTPKDAWRVFRFGHAALFLQLLWRLRGFDVIHLHYPFYGGALFAVLAGKMRRTPVVATYHMKTKSSGWLGLVFRAHRVVIGPLVLRMCNQVLVSSLDYAKSIRLRHPNLKELPFGIDVHAWRPGANPAGWRIEKEGERGVRFLFVGGLDDAHYFKGVEVLLRSCAELKGGWSLRLVGDGNRRSAYETLAHDLGIASHVTFLGRLDDDELKQEFQAASVHVLPSIDRSEAFGLVTLEAAASGIPSIVSDLPGVRTLVKEGKTGRVVLPGNTGSLLSALQDVVDDPDTWRIFGKNARKMIVEKYDSRLIQKKLRKLYENATV